MPCTYRAPTAHTHTGWWRCGGASRGGGACELIGSTVAPRASIAAVCRVSPAARTRRLSLRPASWLSGGSSQHQSMPQAARSLGQPRPIGRLGRAGTQATRASLSTERCRRTDRRRGARDDAAARSRRGGAAAPTPAMGRAAASCVGPRRLPSLLAVPCLRARARSKSSQVSCHYQFSPITDMRAICLACRANGPS